MKKLIVVVGLCVVFPVCAMELTNAITDADVQFFAKHLNMAVGFGLRMVEENQLPATNPMHVILCKINDDLSAHNGDLKKMISSNQVFVDRIQEYQKVDVHEFVQLGLQQIRSKVGNVDEAQKFVIRFRLLSSGLALTKRYPTYSNAWMGEVQKEERINFMLRNENYPLDDSAVKDYTAMFLYQMLFAPKVD